MEPLSNVAMWAIVVGFLQPPVLSLIMQTKWNDRLKALVAFGFSLVTGAGTAWLNGSLNGVGILTGILVVAVTSIAFYKGFWKPTGVSPSIERATNLEE